MESKKWNLNTEELKSIGITVLMAGVSAAVAQAIQILPGAHLGSETTMIVVLAALKFIQKMLAGSVKTTAQ